MAWQAGLDLELELLVSPAKNAGQAGAVDPGP